MEDYQEKKYLIVWLYISIILHLLVGIIMITLKPLDPLAKEPDPAKQYNNQDVRAQVIFMQEPQKIEFADRTQAFIQGHNQETAEEENNSDDATRLKNETKEDVQKNQDGDSHTTLPDNPLIVKPAPPISLQEHALKIAPEEKPVSKKYRPMVEKGLENSSKLELLEPKKELPIASKKKFTLNDLQKGFASFTSAGDNYYLSSNHGVKQDTELGLKQLSYMNQLSKIYQNAYRYINSPIIKDDSIRLENSIIEITIERSGKISNIRVIQKSGNTQLDTQHLEAINAMGTLPPIPKYLQAPLIISTGYYYHGPEKKFNASFIQKNF